MSTTSFNLIKIIIFSCTLAVAAILFTATEAAAATLSVTPGTGVYTAGNTFTTRVVVNTSGEAINAAEGTLSFNTNELSVLSVNKGSIFSLWPVEPSFSNSAGTITFSGGSPSGYAGSNGTIVSITFRSKGSGNSKVSFSKGSVLAADGLGTNLLTSMSGGAYTIAAAEVAPEPEVIEYVAPANTPGTPQISSNTHNDPAAWHQAKTATLTWTLPSGVTGVRTLLDENSGSIPTRVYENPISQITLEDLEEGEQYFHLQFRNADGWGRVAHYRLAVDSGSPEAFSISLPPEADLTSPQQTLALTATDTVSAVTRFLIQIDGGEPYEYIDEAASGTVQLPNLTPGHHTVIIEAFDQAGNSLIDTFSFAILAFDKPQFTEYPAEINEDVIPVLRGITRPDSEVTITVRPVSGGDATEQQVRSDESGVFTFIPENRFQTGVYEFTAVAIDQHGAQSEASDAVRIAVQKPGYVTFGNFVISVLSIIVPIIALLALLVLVILFFFVRIKKVRRVVARETAEALSILDSEFDKLLSTVTASRNDLKKSRRTKKLTKAEDKILTDIESALQESRKKIADEIDDVDDIVT